MEEGPCDDARWRQEAEPNSEDAPASLPSLPLFFRWAKHDEESAERSRSLVTRLRTRQCAGRSSSGTPTRANRRVPRCSGRPMRILPVDGVIVVRELAAIKERRITALSAQWDDIAGDRRTAILPVQVEVSEQSRCEATEGLTAQAIIDCLVADSDPARWIARDNIAKTRRSKAPVADAGDTHKAVDVSSYTLYRVRWFGQALAMLAKRIAAAPPTATYLRHRLFTDLLSPTQLARALRKEWRPTSSDPNAFAALAFALAELRLTVAHAFTSMAPTGQRSFAPLFNEAIEAIGDVPLDADLISSLQEYLETVAGECRRLIPWR